ncbi:hypothetical protein RINTHH_9760 [Richelia intracellularis HH01]|uniref:Uncharacterized protein n=1 Tax=Richelia intracellularis HH01 TaxID=1165094 RepID=M1X570_9NOST|nr:hypothetical protein RINTHH_9760 [Richelia intracellularis HH01]
MNAITIARKVGTMGVVIYPMAACATGLFTIFLASVKE